VHVLTQMDRKNKRAAQQSISAAAKEERREEKQQESQRPQSGAPVHIPETEDSRARSAAAVATTTSPTLATTTENAFMPWLGDVGPDPTRPFEPTLFDAPRSAARTLETTVPAFGSSPFSHPGSHGLFFNASADARIMQDHPSPWTARADPLADSGHGEDFLPSSLSDLLTPDELERRMRNTKLGPSAPIDTIESQSVPTHAHEFSPRMSPPAPVPGRMSFHGMNQAGASRRAGSHSVQASPFLPPLLDGPLDVNVSPPGTLASSLGGERISVPRSFDDARRRTAPGSGTYRAPRVSHVPISPAILPASEADVDEAIFELE